MSLSPHTGRARFYVHADQDPKQAADVVAKLAELGVPESAILEVCFDVDAKEVEGSSLASQEILRDAQAGRFEILIVGNLDRLSADAVELSRLLIQFDDAGVLVISLAEGFCTDASLAQILFPITASNKE